MAYPFGYHVLLALPEQSEASAILDDGLGSPSCLGSHGEHHTTRGF